MLYEIGQKVCLWQEHVELGTKEKPGFVRVLREVVVTIQETKTGVLGEFSRNTTESQSLRGVGDDGKIYEKHWEHWPESQTNDFIGQWSLREDGEGEDNYWLPKEAVYAHNSLVRHNRREGVDIKRLDASGQPMVPKGDVVHCEKHDEYHYERGACLWCHLES